MLLVFVAQQRQIMHGCTVEKVIDNSCGDLAECSIRFEMTFCKRLFRFDGNFQKVPSNVKIFCRFGPHSGVLEGSVIEWYTLGKTIVQDIDDIFQSSAHI